jgi:hypothetical protein
VKQIASIRGAPVRLGGPDRDLKARLLSTGVSLAVHLVIFIVLLAIVTGVPLSERQHVVPLAIGAPENEVTPYLVPAPAARAKPARRVRRPTTGLGAQVVPEPQQQTRPSAPARPQVLPGARVPDTTRVVAVRPPGVGTHRLATPGYGDGRLWIPPVDILQLGRPLPLAKLLASGGGGGGGGGGLPSVATLDSTVTARLQAFLDTMPRDSFALPAGTPQWTTKINGRTWGIDGKWIYLGGLKLPAALLALLPFPQGNIDQARGNAALMEMREDIMQAAQRAATREEFNKYVKELRERKDKERRERLEHEKKEKATAVADTTIP